MSGSMVSHDRMLSYSALYYAIICHNLSHNTDHILYVIANVHGYVQRMVTCHDAMLRAIMPGRVARLPVISKAPKGNGIGATGSKNPRAH